MGTRIALLVTALALLAPLGTHAGTVPARYAGWGTDGRVTARFAAGAARWDAKAARASIGFIPVPPTNADLAGFAKTGWWADSMKQRGMSLHLEFKAGEPAASLRALHQFAVAFYKYPANPHDTPMSLNYIAEGSALVPDLSDTFRGWGWRALAGELRPGGRIRGHVAFQKVYENKQDHIGPIPYRWDLEFDTVLQ